MKKLLLCALLVMLFVCPAMAQLPEIVKSGDMEYTEGIVMVLVEAPNDIHANYLAQDLASKFDLEIISVINLHNGLYIISIRSDTKSTVELIHELSSVPYVKSADPNYIYYPHPIDPDPIDPDPVDPDPIDPDPVDPDPIDPDPVDPDPVEPDPIDPDPVDPDPVDPDPIDPDPANPDSVDPDPPAEKGSGGCNAGYGYLALLLFANMFLRTCRKK